MDMTNDQDLRSMSRVWNLDGDLMTCRVCKRSLIASRDGEELNHASGCKNAAHGHPWADLRSALKE
jgi:hypothetical protein